MSGGDTAARRTFMNLSGTLMEATLGRVPRPAARWSRLFTLGAATGLISGLAAAGLHWALTHGSQLLVGRFTHLGGATVQSFHWGVLLLPAAGGLVSGIVVRWFCPGAVGHGTDALTRAFHHDLGALPIRGPLIKAAAAVGVISCGGSAGPEGPIAALGASVGSTVGRAFRLTPRERRVMLVAGCAAGIGAIFQCPLGGALFAASILYREPEFESDAIVPSFVASVVGYSVYMLFPGFGHHLLHDADRFAFTSPAELVPYAVLGILCGLLSIFFFYCFRAVERGVARARIPVWLAPALGGLATGGLACFLPQVMDGQYRFIQGALSGHLFDQRPDADWLWWAALFGAVALWKCLATALTVGSGAPGGVLGPSVFIGGAAGAFVGAVALGVFPSSLSEDLRQSLIPVGMAGVLAASMRTPMAAVVMTIEMTGSYGLIVPLMLVCSTAYVVSRRHGLNGEQVRGAAESPAHAADAVVHVLQSWRVEQLMERDWPLVAAPNETLRRLIERIQPGTRPVFAVVDGGAIVGLISVSDIQQAVEEPALADALIASDMMTDRLATVFADEDVYQALNVFRFENHDVLPVISRGRRRRWVGMLTRASVYRALRRHIDDTQRIVLREHAGLSAIEQEGQLQNLVLGVSPVHTDRVKRLMVPLQAIGLSLRESNFGRRFNAQVVAIQQPDGEIQCPPDLDAPLSTSQRLLAIVSDPPSDVPATDVAVDQ